MSTTPENRSSISRFSDIVLRMFIDTNVLIDYIENFPDTHAIEFIDGFSKKEINNIELITSDYVLWEFYGHFRDELYTKKLVEEHHYGLVSANKTCFKGGYPRANLPDMEKFGDQIESYKKQLSSKKVTIEKLVGQNLSGFSELVETILQRSKFSYKDTIIFVSALFTNSSIIITLDDHFSCDNHLKELKAALSPLVSPLKLNIDFKRPIDFSSPKSIKRNYKLWFMGKNKKKAIGKVVKTYAKGPVVALECTGANLIKTGDYLCLIKFNDSDQCFMNIVEVKENCLQDYDTKNPITQGKKVTVKCANALVGNCDNALVFLYEA